MIYIHAYPFRVDDPERNTRQMTALARSKNLKGGRRTAVSVSGLNRDCSGILEHAAGKPKPKCALVK